MALRTDGTDVAATNTSLITVGQWWARGSAGRERDLWSWLRDLILSANHHNPQQFDARLCSARNPFASPFQIKMRNGHRFAHGEI
jgi:hypothetical protein